MCSCDYKADIFTDNSLLSLFSVPFISFLKCMTLPQSLILLPIWALLFCFLIPNITFLFLKLIACYCWCILGCLGLIGIRCTSSGLWYVLSISYLLDFSGLRACKVIVYIHKFYLMLISFVFGFTMEYAQKSWNWSI